MPIVRIDYEKSRISPEEIKIVAEAIHGFAAKATEYDPKDISVFASENKITVNAAPVEIYVYATFPNASEQDLESMLIKLKDLVIPFKKQSNISTPFNLSIVKMNWKFQLGI